MRGVDKILNSKIESLLRSRIFWILFPIISGFICYSFMTSQFGYSWAIGHMIVFLTYLFISPIMILYFLVGNYFFEPPILFLSVIGISALFFYTLLLVFLIKIKKISRNWLLIFSTVIIFVTLYLEWWTIKFFEMFE